MLSQQLLNDNRYSNCREGGPRSRPGTLGAQENVSRALSIGLRGAGVRWAEFLYFLSSRPQLCSKGQTRLCVCVSVDKIARLAEA